MFCPSFSDDVKTFSSLHNIISLPVSPDNLFLQELSPIVLDFSDRIWYTVYTFMPRSSPGQSVRLLSGSSFESGWTRKLNIFCISPRSSVG